MIGVGEKVSDWLPVGSVNAVSARELAAVFGLKDIRAVSRRVELERRSGVPICAVVSGDSRGYFLGDIAELRRYLDSLDRRIKEICRTRNACEQTLLRMVGQTTIDGW